MVVAWLELQGGQRPEMMGLNRTEMCDMVVAKSEMRRKDSFLKPVAESIKLWDQFKKSSWNSQDNSNGSGNCN